MPDFTVVSFFTPKFASFAPELTSDCETHGYSIHCRCIEQEFDNLIKAFDYKIAFLQEMVQKYQRVLWLDVECRIVRPIPNAWNSPLISTYQTGQSKGYSSGVLMLDDRQLEMIGMWRKYAEKYPRYPDDFVLDFMSRFIPLGISTVPLEFYDRSTRSPIARGNWRNEHTIIQHPTINRWPTPTVYRKAFIGRAGRRRSHSEAISRQRKGIFFRNFGGDFASVDAIMRNGTESEYRSNEWVFDAVRQRYAPQRYWPTYADDYTSKPRTFERSRDNFYRPTKQRSFREKAIARMHLDRDDALHYGHATSRSGVGSRIRETIASVFRPRD